MRDKSVRTGFVLAHKGGGSAWEDFTGGVESVYLVAQAPSEHM